MLERLQKIIARAGIASRRHAEELIRSGQVTVNGVVVTELGAKADPEKDRIEAAGRVATQPAAASYFILHKPPHVVSTMSDPEGRATLRHILRGLAGGVFPVGRLDYDTSGLILLTSDGKLADSVMKVSSRLVQVFWLKLKGRPTQETLSKVGHKARARLRLLRAPGASAGHVENPWYEAELHGARRESLTQAFFAAGHPVEKVKRIRFGPLELGDLPEGQYRQLAPSEVESLRRAVERAAQPAPSQEPECAAAPPAPPVAARPSQRKKWQPAREGMRGKPPKQRDFRQRRPGPPGRTRFAPAAPGAAGAGSRPPGKFPRAGATTRGKFDGKHKPGRPRRRPFGARPPRPNRPPHRPGSKP